MKIETVRIHFLSDVLACCYPENLLPWQRFSDFSLLMTNSLVCACMKLAKPNEFVINREKSLHHVAMVAKFLDNNKPKRHLKSGFALFQTSLILFNFI